MDEIYCLFFLLRKTNPFLNHIEFEELQKAEKMENFNKKI